MSSFTDTCTQVPAVKKTRQKTEYSQPRKPCSASRLSAHGKTINLSSDAVTSDGTDDFRNEKARTVNHESDQLMTFSDIMDDIESNPQNKMKLPTSSECLSSHFRMLESLVVKSDIPEPLPKASIILLAGNASEPYKMQIIMARHYRNTVALWVSPHFT